MRLIVIYIISLSITSGVFGQDYPAEVYAEDSGLLSPLVFSMVQDDDGRIWFASRDGLSVYDGYEWSYKKGAIDRFVRYSKLRKDENGDIWAAEGTGKLFLTCFKNGIIDTSLIQTKGSSVFISDFEVYNDELGISAIVSSYNGQLFTFSSGAWSEIPNAYTAKIKAVYSIHKSRPGYMLCTSAGIFISDRDGNLEESRLNEMVPAGSALTLYREEGSTYILGKDYLAEYSSDGLTYIIKPGRFYFESEAVYYNLIKYGDKFLFSNQRWLKIYNSSDDKLSFINETNGSLSSDAFSIIKDRESNIWLASSRGVLKFYGLCIKNIKPVHSIRYDDVTAIESLGDNTKILGRYNGYTVYKGGTFKNYEFSKANQLYLKRILDFEKDENGDIWFAADDFGIGKISARNYNCTNLSPTDHQGFTSLLNTSEGMIVTKYSTIYRYKKNSREIVFIPEGNNSTIRKLFSTPDGHIAVATMDQGVYFLDKDFKLISSFISELPQERRIFSVFFHNGDTLIGSSAGLLQLSDGKGKPYYFGKLSITDPVYFINKDSQSNIWVGTHNGVYKIAQNNIQHFTGNNGLLGFETNRDAFFEADNGDILIGTSRGLTVFDHEVTLCDSAKPNLIVEQIIYDNIAFQNASDLHVVSEKNSVKFVVKDISFVENTNLKYFVLLDGYDNSWREVSREDLPVLYYSNLEAGEYELLIRRENLLKDEMYLQRSGVFIVSAEFYQTILFKVIVVLGFSAILALITLYYRKNVYTGKLETEVTNQEKKIEFSENWNKLLFESNYNPILIIDKDEFKIEQANYAACRLFEVSEENLLNKRITEYLRGFGSNFRINENFRYESTIILTDGREKSIEINVSLIQGGESNILFVMITDISDRKLAERELVESEEKYRFLINNIQEGIFLLQEGYIVFPNKALAEMIGFNTEELCTRPFPEFVHEDYREMAIGKHTRRLQAENPEEEYTIALLHKDGHPIYVDLHVSLFYYRGKPTVIGTAKNVTEKMKQERELKALSTVVDQSPVGIVITDLNFNVTYANPMFSTQSGYTKNEIINKNIRILRAEEADARNLTRNSVMLKELWYGELRNKRKNGDEYWVSSAISPIMDNENQVTNYVFIENDISFEKLALEEIKNNERILSGVVGNLPVILFMVNKEGNCTLFKGSAFEKAGITEDVMLGKNISELRPVYPEIASDLERASNAESFKVVRRIGESIFEILFNSVFNDEGQFAGFIGISFDVTERQESEQELLKAKEDAERSDRLKSEFLAQISHEIRTPINSMMSFTSLIKEDVADHLSTDLMEGFGIIERGGRRLIRTVDLILNMSEIQAESYEPNFERINLHQDIFHPLIMEVEHLIDSSKILFRFNSDVADPVIQGDRYTVYQIFNNILDNAVKYTDKGRIIVNLSHSYNERIRVDIIDTGIGMTKEFLNDVFEPFSQEETGYTRRYEGNGLGMALVKEYVKLNDAEIEIESEKGRGTKVSIWFDEWS